MLLNQTGNIPVSQIKKAHVNTLLNQFSSDLKRSDKTNHNVNSMLRILKALFYHAINVHDIEMKNPCVGIREYPLDHGIKYIPSSDQIEEILLQCDDEERLLIAFVMETGCRINEALRFSDTDILDSEIVLYTRKSKNSNLTGRKVPTPYCIINIEFQGRLFNRWSLYPRFLEKKIYKSGQRPWGFHSLRHRYASRLSKKGTPLFEIMSLLGHSNLSTTQKYLQLLP